MMSKQAAIGSLATFALGAAFLAGSGPVTTAAAQSVPGLIVATPEESGVPGQTGRGSGSSALPSYGRPPAARTSPRQSRPQQTRRPAPKKKRVVRRSRPAAPRRSSTSIVVLVNDDPITEYEVRQRARLMSLRANLRSAVQSRFRAMIKRKSTNAQLKAILKKTIDENRGQSREYILKIFERRKKAFAQSLQKRAIANARAGLVSKFREKALDELVEERLKLHEAKRLKIAIDDSQLDQAIQGIAKRNKLTRKQFEQRITKMGVNFSTMRERIRTQISWRNVIRARFSRLISVNQREIDEVLAGSNENADDVSLKLHRITLTLPENFTQATLAKRLSQAESIQRRYKGCSDTKRLARNIPGARFEDLGTRKPSAVPEPTRSLLMNATDGQMVPPNTASRGIELYAVCGRSVGGKSLEAQAAARAKIRQREFDIMARRHLMDLKRDAHIERRG